MFAFKLMPFDQWCCFMVVCLAVIMPSLTGILMAIAKKTATHAK